MRVPLFSWFPLFSEFPCAKMSTFYFIFKPIFCLFTPISHCLSSFCQTSSFLLKCPLTPLISALDVIACYQIFAMHVYVYVNVWSHTQKKNWKKWNLLYASLPIIASRHTCTQIFNNLLMSKWQIFVTLLRAILHKASSLDRENLICAFGPWTWIQNKTSDESS